MATSTVSVTYYGWSGVCGWRRRLRQTYAPSVASCRQVYHFRTVASSSHRSLAGGPSQLIASSTVIVNVLHLPLSSAVVFHSFVLSHLTKPWLAQRGCDVTNRRRVDQISSPFAVDVAITKICCIALFLLLLLLLLLLVEDIDIYKLL